ncbi:MAG TPA: selenium-dependent molybdenum cofactor biosynthesis protein YqeB [Anaerolineae bacterium]|nr:selenium-dependent molybdenum cofactor biosynthesis protein YqeB [Anaerolineae bacterium]
MKRSEPLSLSQILVLIKGAGDLASGVAYRLKRSGFALVMTELPAPLFVRRTVCFGEAVYSGETRVEGVVARRVESFEAARQLAATDVIPVLVDPPAAAISALRPAVVVDAILAKVNTGTTRQDAPLVIALGPGFSAGQDCHVVIETNRGHNLGRVIDQGPAEPDTKTPGVVKGYAADRVLRAPAAGRVIAAARIGDPLTEGQLIATVAGREVRAPFAGVLRGLIHEAVEVSPGAKIGDLDPRGVIEHCFTISDKSLAVAGGVLEAILASKLGQARPA